MNTRAVLAPMVVAWLAGMATAGGSLPTRVHEMPPGSLQTCLAPAADFSPVYPTTSFPADHKVVAVFRLGEGEAFKKLIAKWLVIERSGFATATREVARSEMALSKGADRGWFGFDPDSSTAKGRYRVEIAADGKPWRSADFSLVEPARLELPDPTVLFPLSPGSVIRYTYLIKPGKGSGPPGPPFLPEQDGVFWTPLLRKIEGLDADGTHVVHQYSGLTDRVASEVWYVWNPKGLQRTKIARETSTLVFDPPNVLIPLPLRAPVAWSSRSKDGSVHWSYHLYGPVPIAGIRSEGVGQAVLGPESLGYVVLEEDKTRGREFTSESHFTPAEGMVRKVWVGRGADGRFVRMEMLRLGVEKAAGPVAAAAIEPVFVPGGPGIELRVAAWVPPLDPSYGWWGIAKAGERPDKVLAKSNSDFRLVIPAGVYDIYWMRDYDLREHPMRIASSVEVKEGHFTALHLGSGIRLNVAEWVPPRDRSYGWAGIVRAGDPPAKRVNWTKTGDKLLAPAGLYDVYWVQDYDTRERPILLASKVEVKPGQIAHVGADSGIAAAAAPWVPKRDRSYGYLGIVRAGGPPNELVNWTKTGDSLLAPPGSYDLYWVQDYDTRERPMLLASALEVKPGERRVVSVDSGIRLKVPAGTPPLDKSYGWWAAVPSGAKAKRWVNMVKGKLDEPLLVPPGRYDLFCRRNYEDKPHCIAAAVAVSGNRLVEVETNPLITVQQPIVPIRLAGQAIRVCLALAADMSPVFPSTRFATTTKQWNVLYQIGEPGEIDEVECKWLALDSANPPRPLAVLGTGRVTLNPRITTGSFTYRPDAALPPGNYRVELLGDGRPWQSHDFTLIEAPPHVALARPEDFLPLAAGTSWSYALVMEAGRGQRLDIPGIVPDADGRLRGNVALSVLSRGDDGARLETRLNGQPIGTETWLIRDDGLFVTQRQASGSEPQALAPPERLVAFPLQDSFGWTHVARDGSAKRTYRMWGPVPIMSGSQMDLGYVVLSEETTPQKAGGLDVKRTVERHYLPRFGLIREIQVTGCSATLLTRQELVLRPDAGRAAAASSSH